MLNSNALQLAIQESGLKKKAIADYLNITQSCFTHKITGDAEFKLSEVTAICEVLNLNSKQRDRIFFA